MERRGRKRPWATASRYTRRRHDHDRKDRVRTRHRPRSARAAADTEQDVQPLPDRLPDRAAEHARRPRLDGAPRRPAGNQPRRRRVHRHDGARPQLHHQRAHQVRPQELPLSRPRQGLSDIAVRRAHRERRVAGDRGGGRRRPPRRYHAGAPGRGHSEAPPPRRARRRGLQPRRPEPVRHSPHGDRRRARPALRRGGPPLPRQAPRHPSIPRRQHGEHGGGQLPLRRQRQPQAQGIDRPSSDQGRGEEHEQLPLGLPGAAVRDRTPDGPARRGRADRPGDPRLERGKGGDDQPAQQGAGPRLPLLPRAGPAAAGAVAGLGGGDRGNAAGAPRCPRPPLPRPVRPLRLRRRAAHLDQGHGRLLRGGGEGQSLRRRAVAGQGGGELGAR